MGYETYLEKEDCHDCRARPGELHSPGCDTEQCPACGRQAISCVHGDDVLEGSGYLWRSRIPWSGVMSMIHEAVEYGFFVRWEDAPRGDGPAGTWVACDKDHPEAMPDRNSVVRCCVWDRELRRFVLPSWARRV